MSDGDFAALGITIDATQVTPAASKLDTLTEAGAKAEKQTEAVTVSAKELATALAATGNDITKATALLVTQADAAKATATATATVAATAKTATGALSVATATGVATFGTLAQGINASVGITDAAFKKASASAAVFEQSLAGLSALQETNANAAKEMAVAYEAAGVTFVTAAEAQIAALDLVNGNVGITDAAFKSASASASVFATSLEGLAAIEASAAEGMSAISLAGNAIVEAQTAAAASNNAFVLGMIKALTGMAEAQLGVANSAVGEAEMVVGANASMAESLGALGTVSVQTSAKMIEAEQATAAAAVESAGVQIAAHGAVSGSSTAMRETLTLAREASVGNFTRMAGSASILLQALGLLNKVLIPLAAAAVIVGGSLAVATNQINSGVQGTGDLTKGLGLTADQLDRVKDKYVTMGDTAKATFQVLWANVSSPELAKDWQDTWNLIATVTTDTLAGIVGAVVGTVRVIEQAWQVMPTALGGAGSTAGINFSKAFESGIDDTKKSLDKFYSDVGDQARTNATNRILKEAGSPSNSSDSSLNGVTKQIQQLNDQTAAQNKLNLAVESGSLSVVNATAQQKIYGQTASSIAKIELDNNLTQDQKRSLIDAVTTAQRNRNESEIDWQNLLALDKTGDQIELIQKEIDLIGASTRARVISIATLQAEQEARAQDYDPQQTQDFVQAQVVLASAQLDLKEKTDAHNSSLSLQAKLYAEINDAAQNAASGMEDALGSVGKAIGDMATALTSYAAKQADFAKQQAALNLQGNTDQAAQILLTQKQEDASTAFYASEIAGAKNLFSSKSAVYAALNDIEAVYNALVLANSIARITASVTETTTKVAGTVVVGAAQVAGTTVETATTGVSVANAAAQSSAWGVTAVIKAIASLPFPLDLAAGAAVLAAVIGIGAAITGSLGGSGGATQPADDPAKDLQAANGSGSVLGDATAKSDSIANSLTQLTKDTNSDLEYSNQMVTSLKSIDTHIGDLSSLLAQQLQVGGYFDTSSLGLGSSSNSNVPGLGSIPLLGGLANSLFGGSSSSTTLLDQGITIAATTIGNAIAGGISANAYQTTQTTKKSSALFGLISSSSTSTKTTDTSLPSDFNDQISAIVGGLRNTVLGAATSLGIDGAQQVIDSLSLNIGSVSFKDMTGDQIQSALNAIFSKVGDQLASSIVPQLSSLQQVGEGSLETLSRLVNEYTAVDDAAKTVGFTFSQIGVDSLAARDNLVQLSGGLDNFTSQAQFFVDNFETSAQALAPIQQAVASEMARLGEAGITTKDQFAALVQGIDTSTTAGAQLYAALMNVAPAFAKVADGTSDLTGKQTDMQIKLLQAQGDALGATALQRQSDIDALDASLQPLQRVIDATTDLSTAYANASSVLNDTITTYGNFVSSLTQYNATLTDGAAAANDPLRQYAVTKQIFDQTAAAAANGDKTAIGNLQQVGSDFLTASQAASKNSAQYATDLAAVRDAVTNAITASQGQVDIAKQQLDALNQSVSGLLTLNQSVLSVKDAIDALNAANAASAKAQQDQAAAAAKAAADAQAAAAKAAEVSKATDAFNSAKASADSLLQQRDAVLNQLGPQSDSYVQQNYATDQLGGYMNYYTYPNTAAGQALVQQAQQLNEQYVQAFQAAYALYEAIPGHATGLNRVPYNNYMAKLHTDEAVLTKGEADQWRSGKSSNANHNSAVVSELRALRNDTARMNAKIEKNTRDASKTLKNVTQGGNAFNVKDAA